MGENTEKLSYEKLEQIAGQQQQLILQLRNQLEQQNYGNFHQRMAYLFEVVRSSDKFSGSFVNSCIKELETTLTLPEENSEENEKVLNTQE